MFVLLSIRQNYQSENMLALLRCHMGEDITGKYKKGSLARQRQLQLAPAASIIRHACLYCCEREWGAEHCEEQQKQKQMEVDGGREIRNDRQDVAQPGVTHKSSCCF